jgi:hypothetical protein
MSRVKQKSDVNPSKRRRSTMKKVAFILAIALVFLVGTTTVLKYKISAQTPPSSKIVLWIPIDENCNVVFEKVNKNCNTSSTKSVGAWPDLKNYKKLHLKKTITVTKVEKNPYCYWVEQGGSMVERCI